MDPVNILVLIALVMFTGANYSGSKSSLKSKVSAVAKRASGWEQTVPPNILALSSLLQFFGVFPLFNSWFLLPEPGQPLRIVFLLLFVLFSWLQLKSFKSLGTNYSTEIVIFKDHKLVENGIYSFIRHPQYLSQLLADLFAGLAILSSPVVFLTLFISLPLLVLRGKREEEMLSATFKEAWTSYKKRTGFFIPFVG